jgi:hypothetical protein
MCPAYTCFEFSAAHDILVLKEKFSFFCLLSGSICSSTVYKKSSNVTACLINLVPWMNYPDGKIACKDIAARLPIILNESEQTDIAKRLALTLFFLS